MEEDSELVWRPQWEFVPGEEHDLCGCQSMEEHNQKVQQSLWQSNTDWPEDDLRIIDKWLDNGEGYITNEQMAGLHNGALSMDVMPGRYRWIRIYDNASKPKAVVTFYLKEDEQGNLQRVFPVHIVKKRPPNPARRMFASTFGGFEVAIWESLEVIEAIVEPVLDEPLPKGEDWKPLADESGSRGKAGLRSSSRFKAEAAGPWDVRWQFPNGYKWRASTLAPVLLKLRNAGIQRINLRDLQMAVQLHRTANNGQ